MNFFANQQWLIIALVFFGIIAYVSWMRWRDRQWIQNRFDASQVRAMSFGVNFFGRAVEPGKPSKSSGFLLLLTDRIFYRSRLKKIELEIPADRIARVYHSREHKGVNLHQSLVKIDFLTEDHQKDTAAFKVPYPPQWIRAIENTLLKPNSSLEK